MNSKQTTTADFDKLLQGDTHQISQLLQASFCAPENTKHQLIDTNTLINILLSVAPEENQSLLNAVSQQLGSHSVKPLDYAIIEFCDQLLNEYLTFSPLHQAIKPVVSGIRKQAALLMLSTQQWPWRCTPNIQDTLQLIHQHCIGWHPELGRAAVRFRTSLATLVSDIADALDAQTLQRTYSSLETFFNTESTRIRKLEMRIHDAEKGALHAKHAQKTSARTLNRMMAGKKLPRAISEFLQCPLYKSMQLIIINHTENSTQWQQCVELTKTLIWSFQPINSDEQEEQQRVYHAISQISEKLPDIIVSLHHNQNQLESQLSLIEQEHLKVLRALPIDYEPFDLIDNTDPLTTTQTVISNNLLKQVNLLSEGQWFTTENQDSPAIKLTLKLNHAEQLLFTNFCGVKIKTDSFEQFAYKLSSQAVQVISPRDHFRLTGEILIRKLYDNYQNKNQLQATAYEEKQQRLKQKLEAQQAARAKALEEAKNLAIAQQQARIAAENAAKQAEAQRRKLATQHNQTQSSTSDLNVGGLVDFYDDVGNKRQLRLAVILRSSAKYVFVDQTGVKREEKHKPELDKMLAEGSAKIVDEGSYFESSLEKVVNGLREGRRN